MSYTLVVVDMQAQFPDSMDKRVQENCKRAIRKAVKDKAAIIFLEYDDYGPTLPCLTSLAKKYKKAYHAVKCEWDGSPQSLNLIKKYKLADSHFKVCGVYTECCVQATVYGLSNKFPKSKINLLGGACNSWSETSHKNGLDMMKKIPNVRVYV